MPAFKTPTFLWIIVLLAFFLRSLAVVHNPLTAASLNALPDQKEYLELAQHWVHGSGYWLFDARFGQTVRAYRTPGYPAFIAACAGEGRIAIWLQAITGASIVIPVYWIGLQVGGSKAATLASLLAAMHPLLIYFTSLLLSDSIYACMLVWSMALVLSNHRGARWVGILIGGMGVLVRPSTALLVPCLVAILPRGAGVSMRWKRAVGATLLTLALLFPWAVRNRLVLGLWIFGTTNDGITLYDGFHATATGASDQTFTRSMPELAHMSEVDRNAYLAGLARHFIATHPSEVLHLAALKIMRTWSPIPLNSEYASRINQAVGLVFCLPLMLLALAGFVLIRFPTGMKAFLLTPVAYFTLAHAFSVGSIRYRLPVEPILCIVAALTLTRMAQVILRQHNPRRGRPE